MGKRTGGKRTGGKRGAPFGNRNRLCHGRYARSTIARRREIRALITRARNVMTRAAMVARARHALLRRRANRSARASLNPNPPTPPRDNRVTRANFSKTPPRPPHNLPPQQRGRPP
jgi:hypothetical protein